MCVRRGSGTITVWENVGGKRGAQLYELPGIPLTPGPLLVVVKVAASQVRFVGQFIASVKRYSTYDSEYPGYLRVPPVIQTSIF